MYLYGIIILLTLAIVALAYGRGREQARAEALRRELKEYAKTDSVYQRVYGLPADVVRRLLSGQYQK